MNDAWGIDDNQDLANLNNGPKPLRDAYEAQKKANDDLTKRLAALETAVQRNAVADLIESQGVPRGAAKYYSGDSDPEKVTSWVNDMRATFGGAAPAEQQTQQPALNSTEQNQWQRMNEAGSNGVPVGNMEAAEQALNAATSTEERIAAFAKLRA